MGMGRDDGLGALPWKPAHMPQMSSVGRIALALERAVARFSEEPGTPSRRRRRSRRTACGRTPRAARRQLRRCVVEAGDGHAAIPVAQCREDPRQRDGRVLDVAAEAARVQVLTGSGDVDLEVDVAPQGDRQRRMVALVEAGVADDHHVGLEAIAVGLEPGLEVG